MKTQYIHYGSSKFRPITPIQNQPMMSKPLGGFWASPVNARRGWEDWCRGEEFFLDSLKKSFTFTLTDDAKILHIYSVKQLEELPKAPALFGMEGLRTWVCLDFEKLQQEYDGIELHLSEEKFESGEWMSGLYFQLYGWDCDSILIFHDDVVVVDE